MLNSAAFGGAPPRATDRKFGDQHPLLSAPGGLPRAPLGDGRASAHSTPSAIAMRSATNKSAMKLSIISKKPLTVE